LFVAVAASTEASPPAVVVHVRVPTRLVIRFYEADRRVSSAPALYQKYPGVIDEWTLTTAMRADTGSGGGIGQLEDHYKTFIVRHL
jgi:hypothetical protein